MSVQQHFQKTTTKLKEYIFVSRWRTGKTLALCVFLTRELRHMITFDSPWKVAWMQENNYPGSHADSIVG